MMISNKQHFHIPVDEQTGVHVYLAQPNISVEKKVVFIFSHGFSVDGTESFRLFIQLSEKLLQQGYSTVLFDYRGNGYSDLAFEDMTFDTLLKDLSTIVDFVQEKLPNYQIVFWGMSFGCAVASSIAGLRHDISLMVLWGLSADLYQRYCDLFLNADIQKNGFTYISKGFKIKLAFLESLRNRNIYDAIKDSKIPTLLVHGNADSTAPIELSRTAHTLAPDNTTLYEIEGGNHGFKCQPMQLTEAMEISFSWIMNNLNRKD
jgi:pimeloyl-ACP methyl ester carboxylesterase